MTWFVLARVLLVFAVAGTALVLAPFHDHWAINGATGVVLAASIILIEMRLRETAVSSVLGAVLGGRRGGRDCA